ncbi:hypothetical protein ZIOFF_065952 [Zingiber officinale]|uniref:Uncharacterized protein n=2 Tax=Zingiber officinale TaxID=94328 RepID=A0A8J5F238_ZINOF|nr:hypothetical protein ZIOFF_065952 [Zingiber officinale]
MGTIIDPPCELYPPICPPSAPLFPSVSPRVCEARLRRRRTVGGGTMGEKAAVGAVDDVGDGMQCVDHPYRSNPGGVCAFCLQEKLGRLVSSSKTTPFLSLQRPPSSSSSPTSFRSDVGGGGGGGGGGGAAGHVSGCSRDAAATGRVTKFPFLGAGHSKIKKSGGGGSSGKKLVASGVTTRSVASVAVLNRSKSVAPRTTGSSLAQVGVGCGRSNGEAAAAAVADSPRKKSFWSFLYHSSVSSTPTSSSVANANVNRRRSTSFSSGGVCDGDASKQMQQQPPSANALDKLEGATAAPAQLVEGGGGGGESPSGSQASSSFGRKVARSRSVGCGSRSFSGDFLERISTGFGDCTLRRVESQREAKPKIALHIDNDCDQHRSRMKERVKCGGLFGGFGMTSAYWLSAAAAARDQGFDGNIRMSATASTSRAGVTPHGRTWSWGLVFASPMRAFRPHSSSRSASATNFISSINATNKMVNSNGSKGSCRLDVNASSLSVQT